MPLRSLVVAAIIAFTSGLVVATFAGFREFLPGLLEGALITVEITIGGCILALCPDRPEQVAESIEAAGYRTFLRTIEPRS